MVGVLKQCIFEDWRGDLKLADQHIGKDVLPSGIGVGTYLWRLEGILETSKLLTGSSNRRMVFVYDLILLSLPIRM